MLFLAGILVVVRIEMVKRISFRERNGQIVVLKLDIASDR